MSGGTGEADDRVKTSSGKIAKRLLRERYWEGRHLKI